MVGATNTTCPLSRSHLALSPLPAASVDITSTRPSTSPSKRACLSAFLSASVSVSVVAIGGIGGAAVSVYVTSTRPSTRAFLSACLSASVSAGVMGVMGVIGLVSPSPVPPADVSACQSHSMFIEIKMVRSYVVSVTGIVMVGC